MKKNKLFLLLLTALLLSLSSYSFSIVELDVFSSIGATISGNDNIDSRFSVGGSLESLFKLNKVANFGFNFNYLKFFTVKENSNELLVRGAELFFLLDFNPVADFHLQFGPGFAGFITTVESGDIELAEKDKEQWQFAAALNLKYNIFLTNKLYLPIYLKSAYYFKNAPSYDNPLINNFGVVLTGGIGIGFSI